eukprot:5066215-Pyramimonas_sp.AAC.1
MPQAGVAQGAEAGQPTRPGLEAGPGPAQEQGSQSEVLEAYVDSAARTRLREAMCSMGLGGGRRRIAAPRAQHHGRGAVGGPRDGGGAAS